MERSDALRLLPFAHATAVRLREAGAPPALIAEALGLDRETVEPLLEVAEAKLAALAGLPVTGAAPGEEVQYRATEAAGNAPGAPSS